MEKLIFGILQKSLHSLDRWVKGCHMVIQGPNKRDNLPIGVIAVQFAYSIKT